MNKAELGKKGIHITFSWNQDIIDDIKTVSGYKWNPKGKFWSYPFTPWHCQQVQSFSWIESLGLEILEGAKQYNKLQKLSVKTRARKKGKLYSFQVAAVEFLEETNGRCILGDEMGLGKTVELLSWLETRDDIVKVLVVAPANVIYKWGDEVIEWTDRMPQIIEGSKADLDEGFIHIMSYGIMTRKVKELSGYDLVVLDECLPAGTPITKWDSSIVPCEDVEIGDELLGLDIEGHFVVSLVEGRSERSADEFVVINEMLEVTPNHPIYVEGQGYVKASEIKKGMRVVWQEVPSKDTPPTKAKVLLQKLCVKVESREDKPTTESKRRTEEGASSQSKFSRDVLQTDERKQSNVRPQSKSQSKEVLRGTLQKGGAISIWRERELYETSNIHPRGNWVGYGESNWYRSNWGEESNQVEQDNSRFVVREASNRGGWKYSQFSEATKHRQEERTPVEGDGVSCSADTEQACDKRSLQLVEVTSIRIERGETKQVYNFQTATGNYFANGILVHNCHYIKGRKGKVQRVDAVYNIATSCRHLVGMSGTPFLNRPAELFNMLHLLNPSEWAYFWPFGNAYCGGQLHDFRGATNREELKERLSTYMVRRLKSEVLDQLPELTRMMVPMTIPDMGEYKRLEREVYEAIKSMDSSHKGYFVNALDKLSLLRRNVGDGKARASLGWIQNFMDSTDGKLVVYCHHHSVVDYLFKELYHYGVTTITGKVKPRERSVRITKFQEEGTPRIILITSAGGEGIDLFGIGGIDISTILFVEREFTPARESQAEARLHRLGQANAVQAIYLVARNTIDEKMNKMIENKRKVLDDIIGMEDVAMNIVADLLEEIR